VSSRVLAAFATADDLIAAARAATSAGLEVNDAYAPYPIADFTRTASTQTPDLGRAALGGGLIGGVGALLFQAWTSAVSWPLDVGGKPLLAWLSFVPVAFELMVLGAGTAVAWGFFRRMRARQAGGSSGNGSPGHRFVLEVLVKEQTGTDALDVLREARGLVELQELPQVADIRALPRETASIKRLESALVALALSALTLTALLWPDTSRRNFAYAPDMAASPAVGTYEAGGKLAEGSALRAPVAGTVAQGVIPLHYEASEADALRAGVQLTMPASIAAEQDETRVAHAFAAFCQPCHGRDGHGDGITIKRGFQPPPSLLTQRARDMKDGQMFHVLTYGQKLMPSHATQLAPAERWRLIRRIRGLQARLPVDPPPFGSAEAAPPPAHD
jgi:mono/diheme cytochrome c family protein